MHLHGRRVSALSVVALSTLALGIGTVAGSSATVARPSTDAKSVYTQLAKSDPQDYVKLDLLAINDFHGNLETVPSTSSSGRINNTPAGGAAYLAKKIRDERKVSRANGAVPITVADGELIGASPLLSAAFHDEPTIKAMNKIGLQVTSVGNHEFDEGYRELKRMQHGGCLDDGDGANGQDSCPAGPDFQYLSANAKFDDPAAHGGHETVFPATKIFNVEGQKVAFIGMTLEGTASIVSQAGIQGITFTDEVETANALVPQLRAKGVNSIIVLLHEGLALGDASAYDDCTAPDGPAIAIAQILDPAIDAVVSGHTHQAYNCVVQDPAGNPRLLTSASSFGRMVTKLHLLIDPKTHDIVRPAEYAQNMIVRNDASVTPSPDILSLIDTYKTLVAPIANKVIGHIEPGTQISRTADADGGDSPLGNLIADAQKADDSVVAGSGQKPVIALMNPGGIRADLVENDNGDVTYGAAFSVQPFNNFVVSMDLTGAQIKALLNQQWNGANEGTGKKILQISGLSYSWDTSDAALPDTDALVPGSAMVDADGDPA